MSDGMREELAREFSLDGRVAVVTGAGSGIGRETARVLALAGAQVMLADVNDAGLADAAAEIEALGAAARVRRTDVSRKAEIDALAEDAVHGLGQVDIWVNCAGVLVHSTVLDATEAEVDHVLGVNLKAVYWGCAAAGRAMRPRGRGSIINVSSSATDMVAPRVSIYSMAKAGVNMLTRSCAVEFGLFGVRVNAVAPGWVETGLTKYRFNGVDGAFDPKLREQVREQQAKGTPIGIAGDPHDIAMPILYLASDASRYVTGQVLRANGGASMP
jgi:3-oxoacyl-[acyl-carrier protein] reductase